MNDPTRTEPQPVYVHHPCGDCGAFSLEYVQRQDMEHYEDVKRLRAEVYDRDAKLAKAIEAVKSLLGSASLADLAFRNGDMKDGFAHLQQLGSEAEEILASIQSPTDTRS